MTLANGHNRPIVRHRLEHRGQPTRELAAWRDHLERWLQKGGQVPHNWQTALVGGLRRARCIRCGVTCESVTPAKTVTTWHACADCAAVVAEFVLSIEA
jgi:hypothetical protein